MDRWQRIERLFHSAVEMPPEHRDAFLREACGRDPELYREVAQLASCDVDADLEQPWASAAAAHLIVGSQKLSPGDRLGPYEITLFLAAGGMGVVFRARALAMYRAGAL